MGVSIALSLWVSGGLQGYGQSLSADVAEQVTKLDQAICLQQWEQAIEITSGLIASHRISAVYRQELLGFRRRLQGWQAGLTVPRTQSSCDRTLPLVLTLPAPEPPAAQPLDWNLALAMLGNPRPIIQFDNDFEPTDDLIPSQLTANSPDALKRSVTPIDTLDGFGVVGGSINRRQQIYSFLARLGDRVSFDVDVTRIYINSDPQLFVFDQSGYLLAQSNTANLQTSIQNTVIPQTDVYFVAVSPQGTMPVLDAQGIIIDWQTASSASFDYTLTLTGVTPYSVLIP